jgi:hypothetical protein
MIIRTKHHRSFGKRNLKIYPERTVVIPPEPDHSQRAVAYRRALTGGKKRPDHRQVMARPDLDGAVAAGG